MIMSHLNTSPLEATLDIKALIHLTAIEDSLITANMLRNIIQSLNHLQSQLLPLLILRNGNIFNMSDDA